MDLELYPKNDAPYIDGYGKGYINISGNKISNTVLLLSDKYVNISNVLDDKSKKIINTNIENYKPDGSIKGLGHESEMQFFLKASNIALEVMQIGPACRTWSVLIGDGRNICAVIETN